MAEHAMFDVRMIRPLRLDSEGRPDFGNIPVDWANGFELVSMLMFEKDPSGFMLQRTRIDLAFSGKLTFDDGSNLIRNAYLDYLSFWHDLGHIEPDDMDPLIQAMINSLGLSAWNKTLTCGT